MTVPVVVVVVVVQATPEKRRGHRPISSEACSSLVLRIRARCVVSLDCRATLAAGPGKGCWRVVALR